MRLKKMSNEEHTQAEKELFERTRKAAIQRLNGTGSESKHDTVENKGDIRRDIPKSRVGVERQERNIRESAEADIMPKSLTERVADLEVRVFRLWDLLTERSLSTGQPKLNKIGRRFAEKFRN
jgi:hypothetical protein